MSNCGCGSHCGNSCNCGCHKGPGLVPGPAGRCFKAPEPTVKLATFVYQEQLGSDTGVYAPQFGKFTNTVVWYQANDAVYIYDGSGQYTLVAKRGEIEAGDTGYITGDLVNQLKEALEEADRILQENIDKEAEAREEKDNELEQAIEAEATERREADDALQADIDEEAQTREEEDNNLQSQIDAMAAATDVIDVVDTYADLEKYDTKDVHLNDIIKVLNDETHEGAITYYRWDGSQWNYVGSTGPYYTKAEADDKFAEKDNLKTINGETLIGTGDIEIKAGGGGIAAIVDTYADLANLVGTLDDGVTVIVTSDETHEGETAYYRYNVEPVIPYPDQADNLMINNTWMHTGDFGQYDRVADASKASMTYSLLPDWESHDPYFESFLRPDLVDGFEFSGDYSLQIEALDGSAKKVKVLNRPYSAELDSGIELVLDGRTYNITGGYIFTDSGSLQIGSGQDPLIWISEEALGEGGQFNFRLYSGTNHPRPARGEPNHWELIGTTSSGSSIELLSAYDANATDEQAYSAAYVNSRLNRRSVVIGEGAREFNDNKDNVVIGSGSQMYAAQNNSVVIGRSARTNKNYDVAIGDSAATGSSTIPGTTGYGVALGANSITARASEVSIGSGSTDSNFGTRYLANVRAGEKDTDAVNFKQMRDYVEENGGGELVSEYTTEDTDEKAYSVTYINNVIGDIQTILESINGA